MVTRTYVLNIGQNLQLTRDWSFTVTVLTVFTSANLELVISPTVNQQYQSTENEQGFDFPVLLPTEKDDAITDKKFYLNADIDFTIDYKFKRDVSALDMEVCDTGCSGCGICSHLPAGYVQGQLYPESLPAEFGLSFAEVPSKTDQTITSVSPASSPWSYANLSYVILETNCGLWTISKAGSKV